MPTKNVLTFTFISSYKIKENKISLLQNIRAGMFCSFVKRFMFKEDKTKQNTSQLSFFHIPFLKFRRNKNNLSCIHAC